MARTKLTTAEEGKPKQQAVKPTPIPKTKVTFKEPTGTREELRPAPKGVSGIRERKLISEPVYEQDNGITRKTIKEHAVIIEPAKSTPTAQARAQTQPSPRAPTPPTKSTLVADARREQARAITAVRASPLAGQKRNQDATLTIEQRAGVEARRKCSQSCQDQFRGNAARLGECIANCI